MSQYVPPTVVSQEWSETLPVRACSKGSEVILRNPPWSLNANTLCLRYLTAVGAIIAVAAVVALLGAALSEDNDMLLYLGTLIFLSLRLGVGPSMVACLISLCFLSLGRAHSGFAIVEGRWEYLISFAVFILTTNVVSRLSTRVQSEAWREQQRAEALRFLNALGRVSSEAHSLVDLERKTCGELERHLGVELGKRVALAISLSASEVDLWLSIPDRREALFWRSFSESVRILYLDARSRLEQAKELRRAHVCRETQRLQSALINSLSHDIQTPLASILGTFEVLRDQELVQSPERRRRLLELGHTQSQRLQSFCRNIINLGKLEGGALKLIRQPLTLEDIVPRALELLDPKERHRVVLLARADDNWILGDRVLLSQIILNLVDNALKFSPLEEQVMVEVDRSNDLVTLSVTDRGFGVLDQERELIFERFYRGTVPERVPGSGLGLHISRELAALHGGTLKFEQPSQGGSRFVLTLPFCRPTLAVLQKPKSCALSAGCSG